MKLATSIVLAVLSLALTTSSLAAPDPTPDSNASVVFLRSNCDVSGSPLDNCFESTSSLSDLTTGWIWNTRVPTQSTPLIVDVGPGEFGKFRCDGGGYVTVRGAGREISILRESGNAGLGAEISNCVDLSFIDIGLSGGSAGVKWTGNGNASWSNVDVVGTADGSVGYSWWDECDPNVAEKSVHYFHGSRVRQVGIASLYNFGYNSSCAETWFFGGEILSSLDDDAYTAPFDAYTLALTQGADFRAFGVAIRGRLTSPLATTIGSLIGVLINAYPAAAAPYVGGIHKTGGMFHMHGGIINTTVSGSGPAATSAYGIVAASTASFVHTPGTAFVVKGGSTASSTRISSNGATVLSPFLWQAGAKPPFSDTENNKIASQDGSDIWVETDCDAAGDCASGGNETHLMIYNEAMCGSPNPWFDTQTGSCRQ